MSDSIDTIQKLRSNTFKLDFDRILDETNKAALIEKLKCVPGVITSNLKNGVDNFCNDFKELFSEKSDRDFNHFSEVEPEKVDGRGSCVQRLNQADLFKHVSSSEEQPLVEEDLYEQIDHMVDQAIIESLGQTPTQEQRDLIRPLFMSYIEQHTNYLTR